MSNKTMKMFLLVIAFVVLYVLFYAKFPSETEKPVPLQDESFFKKIESVLKTKILNSKEKKLLTTYDNFVKAQQKRNTVITIQLMLPHVITELGGAKKFKQKLLKTMSYYKSLVVKIGDYKLYFEPNSSKILATINTLIFITLVESNKEIKKQYQTIFLSLNDGQDWYFVAAHDSITQDYLEKQFPKTVMKLNLSKGITYTKNKHGKWVLHEHQETIFAKLFRLIGI